MPNPRYSILAPYLEVGSSSLRSSSISPENTLYLEAIKTGTTIQMIDGIKVCTINCIVVTLLAIHSMVVVTSPIGDHAPPALAAIMIRPANHRRVFRSLITFCKMVIKTMVAVRLSIMAERINPRIQKIHSRLVLLFVRMNPLMVANPSK